MRVDHAQWRTQKIVLGRSAKGIWDAVDTSPDLGGQIHHASA